MDKGLNNSQPFAALIGIATNPDRSQTERRRIVEAF